VDWQGHDFSMRGMSGIEDAILSGMGHLMSFSGTDSVPAILAAQKYYDAPLSCGGSVPATEHSVMSAGGMCNEFQTFKRLLTEVYPTGILSVVSDTWDLWKVLTDYVPRLKEIILARDGKLVIRPDSGNPVKIMLGNPAFDGVAHDYECECHPAMLGTIALLARHLGTVHGGGNLPMIDHAGAIYGDGITVERCDDILGGIVTDLKLSPFNMVFGIGSYTYEFVTRDTYGWAMKATAVRMGDFKTGPIIPIFKKPVTDDGGKFSHRGILAAYRTEESTDDRPDYFIKQESTEGELNNCAYEVAFEDGALWLAPSLSTVRERVRVL
jgi:nicotinamide phosphoribosyltransferase